MFINFLINLFVFIFGICIGSFLNCAIYRLEQGKKMSGRSFCPHCKHTLGFFDLFPVFSFLFLAGKCRYCHKKISIQYPLVELATGAVFLLILIKFNVIPDLIGNPGAVQALWIPAFAGMTTLLFLFYVASVLIVIFVYDLKHYIIPDKVLLPAIIIAFIFRVLEFLNLEFVSDFGFRISDFKSLLGYLVAVIIAAGFFLAIFLVSQGRWMGFGDVKLAVLMGLLLGLPNVLAALFLAFFFGAIIGVILIASAKKGLKSEIPFGPFLILGTFAALLWGEQLITWYLKLLII